MTPAEPIEPVVLVTGASGRIGTAMVALLRSLGIERRCIDLVLSPASEPWLACDLTDASIYGTLRDFCLPVTHVIHLASRVTASKDPIDFSPQFRIEVESLRNLLGALPDGVRHVSIASSMTVYGSPLRLPVDETHPLKPLSIYGSCKVLSEQTLADFSRERGIPAAALRISSAYGPGRARPIAIDSMIALALKGRTPEVFGDGTVKRDYIFVDDVCRAALAVSFSGASGPINVGTGIGTSSAELAIAVARLAGLGKRLRLMPRALDEQAASSMIMDVRRLTRKTGFAPSIPLEDGLAKTLDYFRRREETP
jgi:UDP-glucose 4-epimerase